MKTAIFEVLSLLTILGIAGVSHASNSDEQSPMILDTAQTSGIDGRYWDQTHPGAMTVDAVHRSAMLRFPGMAEAIQKKISAGYKLARIEIGLTYDGYELNYNI